MAKNSRIAFTSRFKIPRSKENGILEELQKELDLPSTPRRIESFDVSNIQGSENVASMVVCEQGTMKKSEYRKFKLTSVQGADDFLSIYEVVYRHYRRRLREQAMLPDLVLIDGGKGQLHYAYQALSELEIEDIPLASIAKREELIYIQGRAEPVTLSHVSTALHLLQRIRDEAHRFALSYHRKRRSLRDFHSALDRVPGIGTKRKKLLLGNFGSVTGIRKTSEEELTPFVGKKLARSIKKLLD